MQYSSTASHPESQAASQTATIHPKGASAASLRLSICSTTALPCLGAYRQIPVCQTLQWRSKSDLRALLTIPPTHSKSKCTIKNAHLTSSSRLPNAYASYLRDQEKLYCKRYRISLSHIQFRFLQEEAAASFFLGSWAHLNLGKFETGLVETPGYWLDRHHLNCDSEICSTVEKHDATSKVHCATNKQRQESGSGNNANETLETDRIEEQYHYQCLGDQWKMSFSVCACVGGAA